MFAILWSSVVFFFGNVEIFVKVNFQLYYGQEENVSIFVYFYAWKLHFTNLKNKLIF